MNTELSYALQQDEQDPLAHFRDQFIIPESQPGKKDIYLCGNSLGLQPKSTKQAILNELDSWANYGVEGHFKSAIPWFSYHEAVREQLANIVGAKETEVVAMNTLSANLHLLMASFYRPTNKKYKIIIEGNAFPSDRYAVLSQLRFHGYDVETRLIGVFPEDNQTFLTTEAILAEIEKHGDTTAMILFAGVQYLTGQNFDLAAITEAGHRHNILVGFDLAHSVGNVELQLHDWQVDFAAWCSYKYLNSGPGGIAGLYVHEKHCQDPSIPRFEGWWGNDPQSRFEMTHDFVPVRSADAWQLSNPPIFQLASLKASLDIFAQTSMTALREKGMALTDYLMFLLNHFLEKQVEIISPTDNAMRGNQLSLRLKHQPKEVQKLLADQGVITDFRSPDVLRFAVAPLYNSFQDCYQFVAILKSILSESL